MEERKHQRGDLGKKWGEGHGAGSKVPAAPLASPMGSRETGGLRQKLIKPCSRTLCDLRQVSGSPGWQVGTRSGGENISHFFAQYPGPGLEKDLETQDPFGFLKGIRRWAFGPDVTVVSVDIDMESSDQDGHCPRDVFQ